MTNILLTWRWVIFAIEAQRNELKCVLEFDMENIENDSEDTGTKLNSHKQTKFAWTNEVQTFQKERFKELTYVTVLGL